MLIRVFLFTELSLNTSFDGVTLNSDGSVPSISWLVGVLPLRYLDSTERKFALAPPGWVRDTRPTYILLDVQ